MKDGGGPLGRGRLNLVGQGRAGKTALARALRNLDFEETKSTAGVEYQLMEVNRADSIQSSNSQEEQKSALDVMERELILTLARDEAATESVELLLSLWDFGGQSVFYALHHLYLTRHAAFAVLFNMQVLLVYASYNYLIDR